jgi:hypothetical protein
MKTIGKVQILDDRATALTTDTDLAQALRMKDGSILYAAALVYPDKMSLIASPFPERTWPRLVRVSISYLTVRGSIFRILQALNALEFYCRFIEEVPAVSLEEAIVYVGGAPSSPPPASRDIMPCVFMVLELPIEKDSQSELHRTLHALFKDQESHGAAPHKLLSDALRSQLTPKDMPAKEMPDIGSRVNWVSPMLTLHQLSDASGHRAERVRVERMDDEGPMHISLLPWRRFLWTTKAHEAMPRLADAAQTSRKVFVISTVDTDERVFCWHFYDYSKHVVIEFEMLVPAFGLEHIWWEYIYDCIQEVRGWILSSASSSRYESSWSTLRTTAMFPLHTTVSQDDMIRGIVRCFRNLQGNTSYGPRFKAFKERLTKARDKLAAQLINDVDYAKKWKKRNDNDKSRLERLVILGPDGTSGRLTYSHLFADNPFNFTKPLDLQRYERLYRDRESNLRRRRLVDLVVQHSLREDRAENFAVVGAHRTGKTTVLNLIYEKLLAKGADDSSSVLLPVRINASVTPPHLIFDEIKKALQAAIDEDSKVPHLKQTLKDAIAKVLSAMKLNVMVVGVGVEIEGDKLLASVAKPDLPETLKETLRSLQTALNKAKDFRLLIIVDELSDTAMWGDEKVFAVWRYAIESDEFSSLRWLISTSRPIEESTKYSPITNVLRELNVGPLDEAEAEILIDAFSVTAWHDEWNGTEAAQGAATLRPVITEPARRFLKDITSRLPYLLQVACFHIYERATHSELPLINKQLCRKVIFSRVLPELSDFLEHQWAQIGPEARRFVEESLHQPYLPEENRKPDEFLQKLDSWRVPEDAMPPGSRKRLDRSGLRGEDGRCVAPMVAAWLLYAGEVGPVSPVNRALQP